jgi:prepilin signal peptidase PulO-like enzyme (type II secretory pathway)
MLLFYAGNRAVCRLRKDKNRTKTDPALPMAPFLAAGFIAIYMTFFSL